MSYDTRKLECSKKADIVVMGKAFKFKEGLNKLITQVEHDQPVFVAAN